MKRYRIGKKKIIACSILAFSAIVAGAPAVTAFAEESAVPAETAETNELESLRLKKEEAQAAYDAALNDKLLAEDVVENAKRAVKDAQEEYDRVLEQYSTGFAGFLRWVMETETDPVKVEDARKVLEASFADGTSVDSEDPANITRMLYMADWLEDMAEYFRKVYDIEAGTSHAAMKLTQSGLGVYSDTVSEETYEDIYRKADLEKVYNEIEFENGQMASTTNTGSFKGVWFIDTDLSVAQEDYMPILEGLKKDEEGIPYETILFSKINGYQDGNSFIYVLEDGEEVFFSAEWDDEILVDGKQNFLDSPNYYGSDKYMEGFKEAYYLGNPPPEFIIESVYNPFLFTAFIDQDESHTGILQSNISEEDMEALKGRVSLSQRGYSGALISPYYYHVFEYGLLNALDKQKGITVGEAIGVDPNTGLNVSLGSVFNGEGTYTIDEYVRALREYHSITDPTGSKMVLDEKNDDLDKAGKDLAGAEETLLTAYGRLRGAEKEYEEAVAGLTGQVVVPVEEETDVEVAYTGQDLSAAESETETNVITVPREVTASESLSDPYLINMIQEAVAAEPEPNVNASEEISPVTQKVSASESSAKGPEAAAARSEEKETSPESSTEKEKQKNGILAEVMSYIFNGGAIAFILPAGFKKRKTEKGTGSILQGDF